MHVLLWIGLRTQWLCPFFNDMMHRFGPGCDFFAIYMAGFNAARGCSIYRLSPGDAAVPYAYPFRYLPFVAYAAGIPVTLVPPVTAYALWVGVCECLLLTDERQLKLSPTTTEAALGIEESTAVRTPNSRLVHKRPDAEAGMDRWSPITK
jgi:hypothetical protein